MQSNLDDLPVGGGGGGEGGIFPVETASSYLDEQPVGGGSSINPPQLQQTASSEPDHSGTPAERQKSKNWMVRQKLYEEMTEAYKTSPDGKAECFHEQCGSWKKYIQEENNPMGMESLMTCLAAYIDRCDPKILAASQIDLIRSLIEKGLTHTKATVKQKSTECFLSLFEVTEVFDEPTNDALLEMIKHKNAKVTLTSFQALITLLAAYGPKKVQLKPFMKTMEDAAQSTTPAIKLEGLNFYKECFRWLGDSPVIEGLIKNFKQQQIDQLREDFKNIKANEAKKVPRMTRSEQKKAKEQAMNGIIANQGEEEKGEDPGLDLFDAVNILKIYNAEWIEKCAQKKWPEKKADLESLYEACNQPKLANGDFSGIVNLLKEQMKDSMAPVSLASIRVCGILAEKLKRDFEGHARQLVCPIIYRFKEKKTNIMDACHVALENFLNCVNIEQIKDDLISTGLLEKPSNTDKSLQVTPSMKKNTCLFLEKAAQKTYIDVLQRVSSDYLNALIKLSDDPDGDTRGPALQVIGVFKGRLGEAAMSNYLKDIVQQKMTKVNEAAKQVQPSKYDQPEKKEQIAPPKVSQPQKKATSMKPAAQKFEEEVIVPKAKNQFDEVPLGGGRKVVGDQKIGSSQSGYDIDNLGADAFGDQAGDALIMMDNKPKAKPPAKFAQKKLEENKKEASVQNEDDKSIKKAVNMDDVPIPSRQQAADTSMENEDCPVPKGAYNLDDLPADAFGGNDTFSQQASKPIKKPPARLANKAKPNAQVQESAEESPIKQAKAVNLDDLPIGSSKIVEDVTMTDGGDLEEKPIPRGAYNLDALGDDAFGGPPSSSSGPKKPPARFAASKKVVDEEMRDESDVVAPPKKAVPSKAVASKPKEESKGAPKTAGGPKGPQIGDENAGEGLSKEEAIAKVEETFPSEVIENFGEEKKWNEKVLGFQGINQALPQMQPEGVIIEAIIRYTKIKMKDWKESNINLIKESIALFTTISQSCEKMNKRAVYVMMPFLSDKLGDVKLLNSINELLLSLSETVTPKYVALQLLKYGSQAKAPNIIKETCNILSRLTDEFGFTCMPVKEMIDFAIISVNNSNPQVRTASMALFAILYKHAGEAIKNFIKDVKESTMKLVDEEFKKVTPYAKGEYQRKRNFKGEAAFEEKASAGAGKKGAAGGGGLDDLLPRADISKLLTPKLMPLFGDNDWKKRKEAAEKVEEMLKQANMRIKPDGLNELMDKIKQRMADANKAVCKAYMQLICLLVEALGPNAKQFAKKILPPMMQNLADKQSLVRGDAITAMDKWAKECGAELIITLGGPMVAQDNPELRTEMLGWINRNTESIKLVVPEALKECCKPLVECLTDKTPAIRAAAETLITSVMPLTGYAPFQQVITNLKPAVQQSIKPILEKVKAKVGDIALAPPVQQMAQSIDGSQKTIAQASSAQGPTLKPQIAAQVQGKPQIKAKEQPQPQSINETKMDQSLNSSISQKQLAVQTPHGQKQSQLKPSTAALQQTGPRLKTPFAQSVSNFKPEEESEIITINFGQKEKRAEWDRKSKFHIEDFKQDQVEKLKNQAHFAFGQVFTQKLFSQDFKLHCECIDQFTRLMMNQPDSLVEVLDLTFKWTAVRLADSGNTQFGVKIFDFFAQLFNHLQQQQYLLLDFEVAVLVPLLCEKSGLNNQLLKDKAKKLLRMAFDVCDKQMCYNFVVGQGLQSKNLNAIAECLDELAEFIIRNGIDYSSDKEMKLIAKLADSPSKNVRESAVKALGEAFKLLDDNIWRVIGDVTPKVQGLLEARFKKIKGGPALNSLYASASMANFQTARPQTALNDGMTSSLGYKPNQHQLLKPAQPTGLKGPTQAATARNTMAHQKPAQKLGSSINQIQPEQEQVQQQMSQMSLDQPSQQTEHQQQKTINSNLASKLKPLPQVSRQSNPPAPVFHQQQQQIPHQTLLQAPEDDDEDLRIFTSDMNLFDPQQERLLDDLRSHFHLMKYADISKKVDSLVTINEIVCNLNEQTISVMQKAANELISAFVHLINEVFEVPLEKMNVKFVKYFMTIVVKICSSRDLMSNVCYEMVFALAQQLLTRLMIEGLEKVGENMEGDQIQKNLNSSMLRVLENCNHTYLICSLFDLQTLHNGQDQLPKLPNLIVKCILKTTKIIEKIADKIDVGQILLSIHKYLIIVNHENKTPHQDVAIKTAKTLLNELIKIKRDEIWKDYAALRQHHIPDQHIFKWIQVILKSFNPHGATSTAYIPPSAVQVQQMQYQQPQEQVEIIQILNELMNPSRFDATLPRLYEFQLANQDTVLDNYLASYPLKSANLIKAKLNEYAKRLSMMNQGNLNQEPQSFNDYQRQTEALPRLREVQEFQNESFAQINTGNNQQNNALICQGSYPSMRQSLPVLQSAAQPQHQLVSPHIQGGTPQNNLERLQQMKARMHQMKNRGAPEGGINSAGETPVRKTEPHGANAGGLNTSFSAMNNSIGQKWQARQNQIQNTRAGLDGTPQMGQPQLPNLVSGQMDPSHQQTGINNGLNQSDGNQYLAQSQLQPQSNGGARPQPNDLSNRLAEMKAKLAALKNQKQ